MNINYYSWHWIFVIFVLYRWNPPRMYLHYIPICGYLIFSFKTLFFSTIRCFPFVNIDDDECLLKTDTCGVLGPDWVCRNTQGSFRCEKKRCTGQNCRVQSGNTNYNNNNNNTYVNQVAVKCLRGFKTDKNNKCIGNFFIYLN